MHIHNNILSSKLDDTQRQFYDQQSHSTQLRDGLEQTMQLRHEQLFKSFPKPNGSYKAAIKGLQLASQCGYLDIVMQTDSRVLVDGGSASFGSVELESWAYRPPQSLVHVLVSDRLPCPPSNSL
ncbi:hypothetical protein L3X38_013135 [Prunus dulcis]|uniref:Uncharacterized protein n=1 Tax=Prunus dulcis TaxID=3755 RepID=A0AAD4WKN5_PRUDU|nr:hypothetical protein L3X38_013135 [Prunus dulcis]